MFDFCVSYFGSVQEATPGITSEILLSTLNQLLRQQVPNPSET